MKIPLILSMLIMAVSFNAEADVKADQNCKSSTERQIYRQIKGGVFELTNGQIWQQYSPPYIRLIEPHPYVLIFAQDWRCKMRIDGGGQAEYVFRAR